MAEYKIYFKKSVEKDFRAIPKKDLQKNILRIQALASEPRPSGLKRCGILFAQPGLAADAREGAAEGWRSFIPTAAFRTIANQTAGGTRGDPG